MRAYGCLAVLLLVSGCDLFDLFDDSDKVKPDLQSVAASPKQYVAAGPDGRIFVSGDLSKDWLVSDSLTTDTLRYITHDGKYFLLAGNGGKIWRSADSWTWTGWNFAGLGAGDMRAATSCNGAYYFVGEKGYVAFSTDATKWERVPNLPTPARFVGVACDGERVVLAAGAGSNPPFLYFGTDGGTFQAGELHQTPCALGYGNGQFVEVTVDGSIFTSSDGVSWNVRASALWSGTESCAFAYADGNFAVVTSNGEVVTSGDGTTWTPFDTEERRPLRGVTFGPGGKLVAVGPQGSVLEASCAGGTCASPQWRDMEVEIPEEVQKGGGDNGGQKSSCTCYCENGNVCTRNEDCGKDSNGIQNVCGCPDGC